MREILNKLRIMSRRIGRRVCEPLRLGWFSRPSLNDLDRKLEQYMPYRGGVFIEAGANDGISQSNTYYFEKIKGWRGILVEPIPELYEQCRRRRENSVTVSYALVARDYPEDTVSMTFANLMSLVKGARKSSAAERKHIERGEQVQDIAPYELNVPARTLSSIIDETPFEQIDLLSLDVEGYELQVLKGLDFDRHAPKYILIEATFRGEIEEYLAQRYEVVEMLSHHDVLYRRK